MRKFILATIAAVMSLASCNTTRNVLYLQDVKNNETMPAGREYEIRIQPSDMLIITVNSKDHELTTPFNLPLASYLSSGSHVGVQQLQGYMVSPEGTINFPGLGQIYVSGLTRHELVELVERRLIEEEYLKNPIVIVTFQNLKINVLGEVNKPGTYPVTHNEVTLLDALGMAGDLTIYGRRDRVAVIRETGGKRTVAYHDLRSKELFNSPYFYLQQNDVVYVEPNKRKTQQSDINQNNSIGVYTSISSAVVSIATLAITLSRTNNKK